VVAFKELAKYYEAFVQKAPGYLADRFKEAQSVDHEMANDEYDDEDLAAATAVAAKAVAEAAQGANVDEVRSQAYAVELRTHKRARVTAKVIERRSGG
jgi:hypothetical protein